MRGYVHREQNFSCLLVKILWVFTGVGSQNGPGGQCVFFPLSTCIPRWSKRASMSILVSTCTGRRPLDWHKRSCPYPKHHHTSSDAGTCKRAVPVRTTAVHRHPIFCRLSSSLGHKTSRSQKMQPPPRIGPRATLGTIIIIIPQKLSIPLKFSSSPWAYHVEEHVVELVVGRAKKVICILVFVNLARHLPSLSFGV